MIKYSSLKNWYVREEECRHGIYNFIMKRGLCDEDKSRISWTWVETGSTITWQYSSIVLKGDDVIGEFYYVSLKNSYQWWGRRGAKMIHIGKNYRSMIVSKIIYICKSRNYYRGLVQVQRKIDTHVTLHVIVHTLYFWYN